MVTDVNKPFLGFESAEALFADTADLFREVLFVPNHMLPPEYQGRKMWEQGGDAVNDYKVYGTTAAAIERKFNEKHGKTMEREKRTEAWEKECARIRANEENWNKTSGETEDLADALVSVLMK